MDITTEKHLEFRRKFLKLVGAEINVTDHTGEQALGVIKMKAWKLREDIRLFSPNGSDEILRIHARNVIDFGGTYDVFEKGSDDVAFSMQRKGLRSAFVRDHWNLLDANGTTVGAVHETSSELAIVRRWIGLIPVVGPIVDLVLAFLPVEYTISQMTAAGEQNMATITHRKNPFIVKMALDTSAATSDYNPYVGIAATALLSTLDAAKN